MDDNSPHSATCCGISERSPGLRRRATVRGVGRNSHEPRRGMDTWHMRNANHEGRPSQASERETLSSSSCHRVLRNFLSAPDGAIHSPHRTVSIQWPRTIRLYEHSLCLHDWASIPPIISILHISIPTVYHFLCNRRRFPASRHGHIEAINATRRLSHAKKDLGSRRTKWWNSFSFLHRLELAPNQPMQRHLFQSSTQRYPKQTDLALKMEPPAAGP